MEVSENGGTPIAGWFIDVVENPINMGDLGVPHGTPVSGNLLKISGE